MLPQKGDKDTKNSINSSGINMVLQTYTNSLGKGKGAEGGAAMVWVKYSKTQFQDSVPVGLIANQSFPGGRRDKNKDGWKADR